MDLWVHESHRFFETHESMSLGSLVFAISQLGVLDQERAYAMEKVFSDERPA